jgi:4-carboxymuconolactone decarboxylase
MAVTLDRGSDTPAIVPGVDPDPTCPQPRLPRLLPGGLSRAQRQLYDEILGGPRAGGPVALTDDEGGLLGPFNAMLLDPPVGTALQALGAAIRYRSALPARAREIAILVVAAHWGSEFELQAHDGAGRAAGLSEQEIATLRQGSPLPLEDPREATVLATVRALVQHDDLDDAAYARACTTLGEQGVFELVALVGYYATLALALRVFRVPASG